MLDGDKVSRAIRLSKPLKVFALARVSIVRVEDDIYFGNDGGEWGGTLYRLDRTSGKVSLEHDGNPVVAIIPDPDHVGCVLAARALAHMMLTDGDLMRVCQASSETLITKEPVWSVAGRNPIRLAFSDGIGELEGNAVVNRRRFPALDQSVAGMHYAKLGNVILISTGVTQSVSVSGMVPILTAWRDQ